MNVHSYDLEKEAVEVQWILSGSTSVSPNIFLTIYCTLNIELEFHLETQAIFLTFS